MARAKIHVGLEIGTSKTCMVVGEVKSDSSIRILGIGHTKSTGVRKGEITDYTQARTCVKDALLKAEEASDVEISSVFLSITGAHIRGENNIGTFRLPEDEDEVAAEHVEEARAIAKEVQMPTDHVELHSVVRGFRLDGLEHTSSPIGLSGRTVEADYHIIHGIRSRIMNSVKCVRELALNVDDVVFAPLATAQIALGKDEKKRGALVIDVGGGTTDYVLYVDGMIAASGCIPVGGDHVTNDIHLVTELSLSKAEQVKVKEVDASGDPARSVGTIRVSDDMGFGDTEIQRKLLNEVVRQRLQETLELVKSRLPQGALEQVHAGVFLTGGTSLMRGFSELAHQVFGKDIYRPESPDVSGVQTTFRDPQFSTVVGLMRYAQILDQEQRAPRGPLKRFVRALWPFAR